jgi:broad specificity phosphatase PhoE
MLCGVVRHTERADAGFVSTDGSFWTNSPDQRVWPHDPPLSDDGVEHGHKVAQDIAKFAEEHGSRFHVVITSPYKRCIQTALTITSALGEGTSMIVDRSLGEVFNEEALGAAEQPQTVVRPMEGWQAAWCGEVDCGCQAIGQWPPWNETVADARLRYANCFLSYLRRGADAWSNFLIVTHADGVAAALSMMPFSGGKCITSVRFGGMFLAKALTDYSCSQLPQPQPCSNPNEPDKPCSNPNEPEDAAKCGWQVITHDIKTRRAPTTKNSLLTKALDSNSMSTADIKALLDRGVRASLLPQDSVDSGSSPSISFGSPHSADADPFTPAAFFSKQVSESTVVFERQANGHSRYGNMDRQASKASIGSVGSTCSDFPGFGSIGSDRECIPEDVPSGWHRTISPALSPTATAKLLQATWWMERSVILCDGRTQGCPIYHAGEGFLKLLQRTAEECLGVPCHELVKPDPLLQALTWPSNLRITSLVEGMLQDIAHTNTTGFALVLNRKSCGTLFVNEWVMRTHKCPMTGIPYVICVTNDVTDTVSIPFFLNCCKSCETYAMLIDSHETVLLERASHLSLDCDPIFNEILSMTRVALAAA